MATTETSQVKRNRDESRFVCSCKCDRRDASTQTDTKGHEPRLSRVNLFTLLSLWMELFPRNKSQPKNAEQAKVSGLVVVQGRKVMGLHCSSAELHVGQVAVIRHGPRLKGCDLYFSRKPCSTCMKMIVNAGVNRVSYWPGDPELSLLLLSDGAAVDRQGQGSSQEAVELDAIAAELDAQVHSHRLPFLEYVAHSESRDARELFDELQRQRSLEDLTATFFVTDELRHQYILRKIGLENFCVEPYFSNLRKHMQDLIKVLASVASSVPDLQLGYGFYVKDLAEGPPRASPRASPRTSLSQGLSQDLSQGLSQGLSQDVARHCMIQAQLLAYRTEDPKVGVGAVIWAEGKSGRCDGTGCMYLVGCGYNGYPGGSVCSAFPWMGSEEKDPRERKYKYIIHAEQNALIFRSAEIKEDENTMLFVTKCPCDECVPLIVGAGIKQVYTTDLDSGKDKGDISYLKFVQLQGVQKFIWQKTPQAEDLS
ncbi:hypothetical protein COCON_G00201200 [Conger conger]|uniref:Cytidine and dCMP deaminase domain-containing protein 1 n=1 Tax=Conger conger TaxID=82655 RepID=A0A9Q1D258_CONCO|nr:hypothetical protein COCON_G00201200 [Conger conger]